MNKIIGLERKSGEYNGVKYDNTIIYFVANVPNVTGYKGGNVKVKTPFLSKAVGIPVSDLGAIIDKEVVFEYDFTVDPPKLSNIFVEK